jgi:hypothetical protein
MSTVTSPPSPQKARPERDVSDLSMPSVYGCVEGNDIDYGLVAAGGVVDLQVSSC